MSSQVTAPSPVGFASQTPKEKMSGMMLAMLAFMENYNAVQDYSAQLMKLSVSVEEAGQAQSEHMINNVIGQKSDYDPSKTQDFSKLSIMGQIAWIEDKGGAPGFNSMTDALNAVTPRMTLANTEYGQVSTFFSGVDNGVNQNSSDTMQTLQIDLQMAQSGPLSTIQTLAQVWR